MRPGFGDLIGSSDDLVALRGQLKQIVGRYAAARRLPPLLLLGETGTGKSLIARALHAEGPRAGRPFVDVNCAAIPETLMEAEMFGFERGAFTDARQAKPGLFAAADGGTIFLDEIGLLPDALQAKLLKVVEDQQIRRLGATATTSIDVWIIAATSEDLEQALRKRRFREDLYHRLAVVTVRVPPLRERGDDVVILAEHLLARACGDYGVEAKSFTPAAVAALRAHSWPGNIRELGNVIERVALLSESSSVTAEVLGLPVAAEPPRAPVDGGHPRASRDIDDAVSAVERDHLSRALAAVGGNVTRAAHRLGLTRNAFRYRLRKHGLHAGHVPAITAPVPAPAALRSPAVTWAGRRLAFLRLVLTPSDGDTGHRERTLLAESIQKIESFGGTIDGLAPAGVTAVFGVDPIEDAPRRAAHAALAIRKLAIRAREITAVGPTVRLAIHAAEVLVSKGDAIHIDMDARHEITRALDALLAHAVDGGIVLGPSAARALRGTVRLDEAVDGTAVLRDGDPVPTAPASVFVGRDDEMAILHGRLGLAIGGRGQVVAIEGEPGIGKSRLLGEFARSIDPGAIDVLIARSVSYGRDLPLLPIVELLRRAHALDAGDTPELSEQKIRSRLTSLGLPADDMAPYLLRVLGLADRRESIAHLSPQEIHQRTLEVVRGAVLASSRARPLVLAVEDLHWMDGPSEGYLAALIDGVPEAAVLVVTTSRAGYRAPWSESSYVTGLRLQPLSRSDARRVLDGALDRDGGKAPLPAATAVAILDRADGNPFFIEELATAVTPAASGAAPCVPDSIEAVLRARLDRLADEPKAVLQAAAVVGRDVPVRLLRAIVSEVPAWTDHLQELQRLEYLHLRLDGRHELYRFKHVLTQEVAYASVPIAHRRGLHGRLVAALEREHGDRVSEHSETLAHHAVEAQLWHRAVGYLRGAGRRAADRSANHEAIRLLQTALEALAHLPPDAQPATAIDIRLDLFWPLIAVAEYHRGLQYAREAATLARDDRARLARALSGQSVLLRLTSAVDEAIETGTRAIEVANAVGETDLAQNTYFFVGTAHHARGDFRAAAACYRRCFVPFEGDITPAVARRLPFHAAGARAWLAWSLENLGEFREALVVGRQAVAIAEARGGKLGEASTSCLLANVHLALGNPEAAIPLLERALDRCRSHALRDWLGPVAMRLGFAYALDGRLVDGIALLEEGASHCEATDNLTGHSTRLAGLVQAYRRAGRFDEAQQTLGRALELARRLGQRSGEAWCLYEAGALAADLKDPAGSEAFMRASEIAAALEMRPLVAHCELGLARLYRCCRDADRAASHSERAAAFYREMNMSSWLAQVEAAGES